MPHDRRRKQLGRADRPCSLCGHDDVAVIESRGRRRGLRWVNPLWRADRRTYELCRGCGAKSLLD